MSKSKLGRKGFSSLLQAYPTLRESGGNCEWNNRGRAEAIEEQLLTSFLPMAYPVYPTSVLDNSGLPATGLEGLGLST